MPTVTRTATLSLRPAPWSAAVTLDQIDPALGITSLALSLAGTILSQVDVVNLDLAPSMFGNAAAGVVALMRPDGTQWLSAAPGTYASALLQPMAQPVRLSGQGSQTTAVGYAPAATASADAALLIGTGRVTAPVTASARVYATGPGSMQARFTSLASADVSVTAATSFGDPSSGGTIGSTFTFINAPYSGDVR